MTRPTPILDDVARGVIDTVAAEPLVPMHVGILAPGGYGKTTLLKELGETYRQAGVRVLDARQAVAEFTGDGAVALLIDDAHLLGESTLRPLCRLAETEQCRLAVAYRPWPRTAALTALTELLGRSRPPLLLSPLDRDQTGAMLAASFGTAPSAALVQFVHGQTGGVPRFVERVAVALQTSGRVVAGDTTMEVPQAAVARFRYDLDRLEPDIERFLLAVDAGVGLDVDLLSSLLATDPDTIGEMMEAARATGLLGGNGMLLPISRRAVSSLIPAQRRFGVRQRLAELQLRRGESVLTLAGSLLDTGIGGPRVAATFEAAAKEALPTEPALSATLFSAAVTAGRPLAGVAADWAQAALRSGDLDSALRLADQVIGAEDATDRAGAAQVAAAALAHRGQLGRSAELYRWAGTGSSTAFATIGLLGTGQLVGAEQLLGLPQNDDPPTLLAGAVSLMARGVHESVTGSATAALGTLVRAAAFLEPAGQATLLPDSPAALAALVALHCGELNIAESVLERAVVATTGGSLMAPRHRLLQAWIFMVRGKTARAAEYLQLARKTATNLEPRDWLFAVALEVGLARRNSDLPALHRIWTHACEAVIRHPVDLFTLLPLGEFATAAARLRDQSRLAPHLHEARLLLGQLGDPVLWSTELQWSCLHAAIIAEQPTAAERHSAALADNSRHSRYCSVLSTAAECWLEVVAGKVDAVKAETAARGLSSVGLAWDGARLAGQAAIRTADRKAMVSLLDCARLLQGRSVRSRNSVSASTSTGQPKPRSEAVGVGKLSDREQEVANLVLAGLTYKQVGDRLFISAKTVEHHMARMRQRLGCTTRTEFLAQLRQLMG